MSDRKQIAGSALAAVPTVLLRHGLGGSRHAERKTHAHVWAVGEMHQSNCQRAGLYECSLLPWSGTETEGPCQEAVPGDSWWEEGGPPTCRDWPPRNGPGDGGF